MCATSKQLTLADATLTEQTVKKLREACDLAVGFSFQSASAYHAARAQMARISTGALRLNDVLAGGIETGNMTELFGEFRTGKTQLCHTMAVTAQIPSESSLGGKVLFIDTEGTFRPERIEAIAQRFGLSVEDTLENISYAKAMSSEHQMALLDQAAVLMAETRYALCIVDSATALFRTDFQGRGELADRQQKLAKFLRRLHILAEEFGVAVVVTNQVTAKVDGGLGALGGPQTMPIGGHIMAHAATTRLSLRKGRAGACVCKVFDSPNLPEAEASFKIGPEGVEDE